MKVVTLPEKILREKSKLVNLPLNEEDTQIAQEMIDYLIKTTNPKNKLRSGIGIAAVQLGYLKRMFYIRVPDGEEFFEEFLINPIMVSQGTKWAALKEGEGCLSINEEDDRKGLVHRKNKITIKGYSFLSKKEVVWELEGFLAIVFQHEYDHLEGKLYIDRVDYIRPDAPKKEEILI